MIFTVHDITGRQIIMRTERWKHITRKHPDIDEIGKICETLRQPTHIQQSKYDSFVFNYYRRYKTGKYPGMYLLVVVKHLNGNGFIITCFYTNNIR